MVGGLSILAIIMPRITTLNGEGSPGGHRMKNIKLERMSLDQLWDLHQKLTSLLETRMTAEKRELEAKLSKLQKREFMPLTSDRPRRAYPKVYPKFQNPADPSQTWAGRGRTPGWVSRHLASGKGIDELRIAASGH